MKTKPCTSCGTPKKLVEFPKRRDAKDGRANRCSECNRAKAAAWYAENHEQGLVYRRAYYQRNKEMTKARASKYNRKHRKAVREINKIRRAADPKRYRAYTSTFYARHPEKRTEKEHRRRAAKTKAFVEKVDRWAVYFRDDRCCYICHKPIEFDDMHVDHVIPLSRGGAHSFANCRASCATCNLRKGAK